MQKTEEGHSRESSLGSSCYRPFLLSGYFPSLADVALVPGAGAFLTLEVERRTEEGFQDHQWCKRRPLSAPDLERGVLPSNKGEKLPAFCLLGGRR